MEETCVRGRSRTGGGRLWHARANANARSFLVAAAAWGTTTSSAPKNGGPVAQMAIPAPGGGAAVTEDADEEQGRVAGEEKRLQRRDATHRARQPCRRSCAQRRRAGTTWSNGAVARCRTDRSPTRQQWWTRHRDFDEARRCDGFQWIMVRFMLNLSCAASEERAE
ncbi:hypothetical protein Scep_005947 [Stephania cephalantha]|uniref:Uncharacterized protein n=1 Tax=Stephania cephalantha TaxID=152367 RepID=A0AAP0PMK2_9MAGN